MIKTGITENYHWIELVSETDLMELVISRFPEFILNKHLAIVSFDGDSFKPFKSEYERGWQYVNEIAYFDGVTQFELEQDSLFDIYDQWLIFDSKNRIESMDIFVIYQAFSVSQDESRTQLQLSDTRQFWKQIVSSNPTSFILNGDKFIYGSLNSIEVEKIKSQLPTRA